MSGNVRYRFKHGRASKVVFDVATSGCPVLKPLGAMASFHIPFCTTRETLRRIVGSYLIKQYFKQLEGEEPDWELKELKALYDQQLARHKNLRRTQKVNQWSHEERHIAKHAERFCEVVLLSHLNNE